MPDRKAWLTLPNLLTLSRIPMAALAWLRPLDPVYVLGLMLLAGLSDVLDGWLERRRPGGGGGIGVWLDPLCDKIFIVSLLAAVISARGLSLWLLPLIALREILQTLVIAAARLVPALKARLRPRFQANLLGKIVTVAQFAAVASILFQGPAPLPLALATAALGVVAVAVYVRRAL